MIYDEQPKQIERIKPEYSEADKSGHYILNASYRENGQRNYIKEGLDNAQDNDIILISDVDEIPDLSKINLNKIKEKLFYLNKICSTTNLIYTCLI